MTTVRKSARAEEDIYEAWLYIALDNRAAADRFLDALDRRIDLLTRHPWSGPSRENLAPGLPHLVSGSYLILYRVEIDGVRIVRVMHGRRGIAVKDLSD